MDWNEPTTSNDNSGITKQQFDKLREKAKLFVVDKMVPWYYNEIKNGDLKDGKHMMYAMVASLAGSALCLTYGKMFGKPGAVDSAVRGLCQMAIVDLETTISTMDSDLDEKGQALLTIKKLGDMGPKIYHDSKTMSKEETLAAAMEVVEMIYEISKKVDTK